MNEQEMNKKFMMFEQQIRYLQEQMKAVEQAIVELESINSGLNELVVKKDNEIIAQVGRGIYVNALLKSEELLVDIGGKNFVKKSIPETQKILSEQIEKLQDVREELNDEMENINEEITKVFMEAQGISNLNSNSPHKKCGCENCEHDEENDECECGDNCECEDNDECKCKHDEKHECKCEDYD